MWLNKIFNQPAPYFSATSRPLLKNVALLSNLCVLGEKPKCALCYKQFFLKHKVQKEEIQTSDYLCAYSCFIY